MYEYLINVLFKYRKLLLYIDKNVQLNLGYEISTFSVFRFSKKIKISDDRYTYTNVQIILNNNYSIQFDNYDFQFLKSYYTVTSYNKNEMNCQVYYNNSLKSIIMINENNKQQPYIHCTSYYYPNQSIVCNNQICSIKFSIFQSSINSYRYIAISYIRKAILRCMKYSSRGFNCFDLYFQNNYETIWYIYHFYLKNELRYNTGLTQISQLIFKHARLAIYDCFYVMKYDIILNNDDELAEDSSSLSIFNNNIGK
jgi:hypothetical protein